MKKKQVQRLRYAATFFVSIAVGVGGCYAWNWAANPVSVPASAPGVQQIQTDGIQVRVRGGVAEWFDGMRWNAAGSVEELEQNDPAAVQSETWQLVAQQRSAAKQQQRQSALTQLSREENTLSTGEKPAAQTTPASRPAASTKPSGSTTPATTTPPPSTPATPPPAQPPAPEQPSTGDGEDIPNPFE